MPRLVASLLILLALAGTAPAHDFWLEPSAFQVQPQQPFAVRLRVGDAMPGEAVKRNPERIVRFAAVVAGQDVPLEAGPAADIAGLGRISAAGYHALVFRSKPARIELEAAKFEAYLKEEGLEHIAALRAERGQSDRPGRELYARCAKALLRVGDAAGGYDVAVGLELELIPTAAPHALAPGAAGTFTLLHLGKPLPGALVKGHCRDDPTLRPTTRTDANGRATLPLGRGGMWAICAVHMLPATAADADWESQWASLAIELPGGAASQPAATSQPAAASSVSQPAQP